VFGALFFISNGKRLLEYPSECFFAYCGHIRCVKIYSSALIALWEGVKEFSHVKSSDFLYHFSITCFADISREWGLRLDMFIKVLFYFRERFRAQVSHGLYPLRRSFMSIGKYEEEIALCA